MTAPRLAHDLLERELRALAEDVDFPPTPDLVTPVRAALAEEAIRGRGRRGLSGWLVSGRQVRLSVVLAVLAVVLAVSIVAAAVLVLGGLRITFVNQLPAASPETAPAGYLGSNLGLGADDTLAGAAGRFGFTVFVPQADAFSKPDAVYYSDRLAGGQVSLVYGPGEGRPAPTETGVSVLITEFPGAMERELAQKSVGPGTTVEILTVNGGLGFWISGRPHTITYRDPTGNRVPDFIRLVHNSLAWEQEGTILRIEGDLTRDEALALAASFAPAP